MKWPTAATPANAVRVGDPNQAIQFVGGHGSYLYDAAGRDYLDLVSGYSSNNFGHCHPLLIAAAERALRSMGHVVGLAHDKRAELELKLASIFSATLAEGREPAGSSNSPCSSKEEPDGLHRAASVATKDASSKVWLASTGARAVELAWKAAFAFRRGRIVAFDLGFHGRSIATAAISRTAKITGLELPQTSTLPFPRCHTCPVNLRPETCQAECFESSEQTVALEADQISAIIVEPAIGARGYYFAPSVFYQRLQRLANKLGIVLIDDEIQMGLGRMGSMLACHRSVWQPDLVIIGKSLGGGLVPISAVIGQPAILDAMPAGVESETFAGSPFACSIAIAALEIIESEKLCQRADLIGSQLVASLKAAFADWSSLPTIEHRGAAIVIGFEAFGLPQASQLADQFVNRCRDAGVLVQLTGEHLSRVAIIPPLTMTSDELETAKKRISIGNQLRS